MNTVLCVIFGAMVGLIVGLMIIIRRKNDEILGLRIDISALDKRNIKLQIELNEEKFRNTVEKIKIKNVETTRLSVAGWYPEEIPNDIIKKDLAYKMADLIVENGLLKYLFAGITKSSDGRFYHTAHLEIVKRG